MHQSQNSICNTGAGAVWKKKKTHEGSRKYRCSAVHKRASLTFGTDTVWYRIQPGDCYVTSSPLAYCRCRGSERAARKREGGEGRWANKDTVSDVTHGTVFSLSSHTEDTASGGNKERFLFSSHFIHLHSSQPPRPTHKVIPVQLAESGKSRVFCIQSYISCRVTQWSQVIRLA